MRKVIVFILLVCGIASSGLAQDLAGDWIGQMNPPSCAKVTVSIAPGDRLLAMFQLRTFDGQTARNPKARVADHAPGIVESAA